MHPCHHHQHPCFNCPPADPVFTDPTVIVQDFYYPQIVPIVHTIKVVKRHHCCPVPKHIYNYVTTDENVEVSGHTRSVKKQGAQISKSRTKR
ncbi:hypothetical protein JCM16418A_26960 [Paenibacillus pini]